MSNIVSALLMIVAAGIIGTFLVVWANSSFAFQSAQITNQTASRINLVKESFVVEDVWFYSSSGNKMSVTIRNTGDLAITISKIYVNNTSVWSTGQVISTGSVVTIPPIAVSSTLGHVQNVWVQTQRGTNIHQDWNY